MRRALGRDLSNLREDAGLSRAAVGRGARVSPSAVGRIETAAIEPNLDTLVRVASTLGCDVSIRLFPSGAPIRDRFQAPMLEAVLQFIDPDWERHVEVPVVGAVRGVIDLVLAHPRRPVLVAQEIHSEIRRAEEIIRRSSATAEGLRGTPLARMPANPVGEDQLEVSRVLVLRSTRATRAVVGDLARTFGTAFPARTVDALAALRDAALPWPGASIIWVHLHGRTATIINGPPRSVPVGR
jgi:transcriptional regulator with XRE-family HTH domain